MICPMCKGERTVYHAVVHEIKLMPCPMCDGLGEIVRTNFDRITDSPKALAEWLDEHCDYCNEIQHWQCCKCPYHDKNCVGESQWLYWLNEESDVE